MYFRKPKLSLLLSISFDNIGPHIRANGSQRGWLYQGSCVFKGKIDIEIISNNDYIVVRLTDNGTGISDTKKVMTPYFTTKAKGTGLGLPIVSKIINEHSGDFLIKNKKDGNGVDIEISFPKINA